MTGRTGVYHQLIFLSESFQDTQVSEFTQIVLYVQLQPPSVIGIKLWAKTKLWDLSRLFVECSEGLYGLWCN